MIVRLGVDVDVHVDLSLVELIQGVVDLRLIDLLIQSVVVVLYVVEDVCVF